MKPYMDWYTAPLNPCSVESLPEPVTLANGRRVWPVALACYELLQHQQPPEPPTTATATTCSDAQQRVGHLEFHLIQVPDIVHQVRCMPLQFQKNPYTILSAAVQQSSGILDGKWTALPSGDLENKDQNWCFATAHSSGEIQLHALSVRKNPSSSLLDSLDEDAAPGDNHNQEDLSSLFASYFMGQSEPPPPPPAGLAAAKDRAPRLPLCLSLAWDSPAAAYKRGCTDSSSGNSNNNNLQRIVSTYSDGRVAIHDVVFVLDDTTTTTTTPSSGSRRAVDEYQPAWNQQRRSATLIPRDCWQAHTLFHNTPAEVWSACFVGSSTTNVVWSGGDEGHLKVWDVRAPLRPVQVVRDAFGAGITCLSPHPTMETIVAVGSYDETIVLFDARYLDEQRPLHRTKHLGGGIWRIKWHPYSPDRMLVAAMHGGCRVLNFGGGWFATGPGNDHADNDKRKMETAGNHIPNTASFDEALLEGRVASKCSKSFTEHESMAYGADWLVCPHPTQN